MFYLTPHSTHFIYGYMASDIWLRTIPIVRKETRCRHIGYTYQLTACVLLYAPSHRQDSTYHSLCYTSRGSLAGTRNSSMGPPHKGSIPRPIAPWANALTTELHLAPHMYITNAMTRVLFQPSRQWSGTTRPVTCWCRTRPRSRPSDSSGPSPRATPTADSTCRSAPPAVGWVGCTL